MMKVFECELTLADRNIGRTTRWNGISLGGK